MSSPVAVPQPTEEALAAAQAAAALLVGKRKLDEEERPEAAKALKTEPAAAVAGVASIPVDQPAVGKPAVSQAVVVKGRGVRLDQNRKVSTCIMTRPLFSHLLDRNASH